MISRRPFAASSLTLALTVALGLGCGPGAGRMIDAGPDGGDAADAAEDAGPDGGGDAGDDPDKDDAGLGDDAGDAGFDGGDGGDGGDEDGGPSDGGDSPEVPCDEQPAGCGPVPVTEEVATLEDVVSPIVLLATDPDTPAHELVFELVTLPRSGTLHAHEEPVNRADGALAVGPLDSTAFFYWGYLDYNGPDAFRYRVSDGTHTAEQDVAVPVLPVNDRPVPTLESPEGCEDVPFVFSLDGFDVDNDDADEANHFNLEATLQTAVLEGAVIRRYEGGFDAFDPSTFGAPLETREWIDEPSRRVVFVPRPDANNDVQYPATFARPRFTYRVRDQELESASLLVEVIVRPVNDRPFTVDDLLEFQVPAFGGTEAIQLTGGDIDTPPEALGALITALSLPDGYLTKASDSPVNVQVGDVVPRTLYFTPGPFAQVGDEITFRYRVHDGFDPAAHDEGSCERLYGEGPASEHETEVVLRLVP